jgi:hypothetical protein
MISISVISLITQVLTVVSPKVMLSWDMPPMLFGNWVKIFWRKCYLHPQGRTWRQQVPILGFPSSAYPDYSQYLNDPL